MNLEIRTALIKSGFRMWQLAQALGMNDSALSRKLRHELPDDEKERILAVIDRMTAERTANV